MWRRPPSGRAVPKSPGGRAFRPAVQTAILAAGAWGMFVLPWRVPVRPDVAADSALFGFHNATAILGLAATLLSLWGLELLLPCPEADRRPGLVGPPAGRGAGEWVVILACAAAGAGLVWGWWRAIPQSYFGESAYFLTRLDMLALGLRPALDFDYGYGPALLEVPWLAHRLSGGRLAADTAFIASVAVQHALGILAASALLARVCAAPGVRIGILLVVTAAGLNITLGPIYALLRFLYAAWAAVEFHRPGRVSARLPRPVAAFLLAFGGLLVSPEVGLATVAALLAGVLLPAPAGGGTAAAIAAAPLAFGATFGAEGLATLGAFGGGAYNFPLLPAPFVLALLGLAVTVLPAWGATAVRGGEGARATAALVVALGMLLPPALGRCDPGHVLLNGLALVTVALAGAWTRDPPGRRGLVTAAVAILLLTHLISQVNQYAPLARDAWRLRGRLAAAGARVDRSDREALAALGTDAGVFRWGKRLPFASDLVPLLRHPTLATPLGAPEEVDRFLKAGGRYLPMRHVPPAGGVFDPAAVRRVVADTLPSARVLVPASTPLDGRLTLSRAEFARRRSRWLAGVLVFPVALPARHDPWIPELEIMKALAAEYEPAGEIGGMVILERRGAPAPPLQPAAGGR